MNVRIQRSSALTSSGTSSNIISNPLLPSSEVDLPLPIEIIDVDDEQAQALESSEASCQPAPPQLCEGYNLTFLEGQSIHMEYPFALHNHISLPWHYESWDGGLRLRSRTCKRLLAGRSGTSSSCESCLAIGQEPKIKGIKERMTAGVHENAVLAYHGFGSLMEVVHCKNRQIDAMTLRRLNMERMLEGRAAALDDYKRLVMQIGNGNYNNVERLIRVALKRGKGIRTILEMYEAAVRGLYRPKSFTEEEEMLGILFWRLGGIRLAEIAHRALGLPGMTTLRQNSTISPILPSYGLPSVVEIEKNIVACFDSLLPILDSLDQRVVHQILMFDEIAIEKRIRWDSKTNYFLGVCREHSSEVDLEFSSCDMMKEVNKSIDDGRVHYTSEVFFSHTVYLFKPCSTMILNVGHCWRIMPSEWRYTPSHCSTNFGLWYLQEGDRSTACTSY